MTHPLRSTDISIFHWKSETFVISRNTDIDTILIHNFYFFNTFFESLEVDLKNMVAISMISAKLATPGILKIEVFRNRNYDVTISVHDTTKKLSSYDSNYIVNLIVWPKFGNSIISMREVIITSTL